MHASLSASSLHSPCVRAHQLPFTNTMFLFSVDKNWCSPCTSLSPFFFFLHLFPQPSLFLLFLFCSVWLCISPSAFQAVRMSDIALSGLYYPPPLPHSSFLLSCSPLPQRRRRVEGGGGSLSAPVLFCVCGVAKINTEHKKKWKDMWESFC